MIPALRMLDISTMALARIRQGAFTLLATSACGFSPASADTDTDTDTDGEETSTTSTTTTSSTSMTATMPTTDSSSSSGPSSETDPPPTSGSSSGSSESTAETTGGPSGSAGCGLENRDPTESWIRRAIDVDGVEREYFVYLPRSYDPDQAYPVVYQFHGCSGAEDRQNNNPPLEEESGDTVIHVRGRAIADCWDPEIDGPEIDFFDAMVEDVEASLCANPSRRFATGFASGAFLAHRLACVRGDMLHGVASVAGGTEGRDCVGSVGALLIHDANDQTVGIDASITTRDAHIDRNGCDADAATEAFEPRPCEAYAGCDDGRAVVWCQTSEQGHGRQDPLSAPAFWNFIERSL